MGGDSRQEHPISGPYSRAPTLTLTLLITTQVQCGQHGVHSGPVTIPFGCSLNVHDCTFVRKLEAIIIQLINAILLDFLKYCSILGMLPSSSPPSSSSSLLDCGHGIGFVENSLFMKISVFNTQDGFLSFGS